MSRVTTPLSLAALALAMFGAWMHWAVLDPRNIGWLLDGADRGQNSLGLIAWLRARPPWPSLHDPLLMAPDGLPLALTDSNPLLALLLRPFAGWLLPDRWQYAGLWLLACVALQVLFAWRLIRPFAQGRGAALVATALLAGTPVFFARYGHINLCAQWLILWALGLFLDDRHCRSPLRWAAPVALAALIHPYLLVMVLAIWGSAQLRLLVTEPARRLQTLASAAGIAGLVAGILVALGYLDERFVSTDSYGAFSMALDALWNAGAPGYSALLPASRVDPAHGFEGMNYLGAGLLALVVAVVLTPRANRAEPEGSVPDLRGLWWLAPALLLLTLVAVGPSTIWQGHVIATLPIPQAWRTALDPVRASGRLFWPAYYVIVFAILASACRMRHGRALLLGAALLQVLDIAPMVMVVRTLTARAGSRVVYTRTPDPRWAGLVAQASSVEVHPFEAYRDLSLLEEIAWRAISACRPVPLRYFYASREPSSLRARLADDARALRLGRLDPTRLYVLIDAAPPAIAAQVQVLDGVRIISPSRPASRPPCSSSPPAAP